MKKQNLKTIKDKGILLIQKYPEISSLVFSDFFNQPSTFGALNPAKYEEARALPRKKDGGGLQKSLNTPAIQECFKFWKEADFLEDRKTTIERKGKRDKTGKPTKNEIEIKVYRFNLEPFFYFFENKFSHVGDFSGKWIIEGFTQNEKNILEFFFNSDYFRIFLFEPREPLKFLEVIPKLYLSWLSIPYLEYLAKTSNEKYLTNSKLKKKVSFDEHLLKKIVKYQGRDINSFIISEVKKLKGNEAMPYFLYDGHYKIKGYEDCIESPENLFLVYYAQLKKLFPQIMKSLDLKMNKALFLDPVGIVWED